jgi:CubicO group peptidase (beta-lactamase class C family)
MNFRAIHLILLSLCGAFCCYAAEELATIQLSNGKFKTYPQLLKDSHLPGISLVVVDNYEVVFTYAGGLKDTAGVDQVDSNTSFNAASISKPVVATLAVMLAEQGNLDLEAPVSQYIKTWSFPGTDITRRKDVTLAQLLTHTAGTSHSGYASHYRGDLIPTTVDTLNHYKNEAIAVTFEPGTSWKYSGGGFLIAQLVLEEVTGQPLAALAEAMLFQPLGMTHSTFYQHGDAKFPLNVAKAHGNDNNVISTGLPICPQAACGLWTTATDMALLAIDIQKALTGRKTQVISTQVAQKLIKIQSSELTGGWSLGWMRNSAVGNLDWFSHSGYNHGTGGLIMASVENGRGIFVFGNGDYRARVLAIDQIVASVSKTLGWKKPLVPTREKITTCFFDQLVGEYENLTPHHFSPFAKKVTIEQQGNHLVLINSVSPSSPLAITFTAKDKFRVDQLVNSQLGFMMDTQGQSYITFEQPGHVSKALRKLVKKSGIPAN